jgi:hypothetical protein
MHRGRTMRDGFGLFNSSCECIPPEPGFVICGGNYVNCGPNATVNAGDCLCDCVPGYVPNPDPNVYGCVPAGGGGSNTSPPDGGGNTPPPDGGGGTPAPNDTPLVAAAEESNAGMILLGVAALGALGYGAYKVSKKSLPDTLRK